MVAILVFGIIMAILALIFDLEALVQFLSIGTLLAYTFVAASIIVLRFQRAKLELPNPPARSEPAPTSSESIGCGEPKEYESFSDKLHLVGKERTKSQGEAGQLKAVFEPYLEFLNNFYPGEVVTVAVIILMVSAVCLCAILVFGNSQLFLPTWSFALLVLLFSLAFLLSLFLISVHEQQQRAETFQVTWARFWWVAWDSATSYFPQF